MGHCERRSCSFPACDAGVAHAMLAGGVGGPADLAREAAGARADLGGNEAVLGLVLARDVQHARQVAPVEARHEHVARVHIGMVRVRHDRLDGVLRVREPELALSSAPLNAQLQFLAQDAAGHRPGQHGWW